MEGLHKVGTFMRWVHTANSVGLGEARVAYVWIRILVGEGLGGGERGRDG